MFTWLPEKYGVKLDSQGMSTENLGFLLVEKHRKGKIGEVPFKSYPSPYKIVDVDYYSDQTFDRTPIDRYEKPEEPF